MPVVPNFCTLLQREVVCVARKFWLPCFNSACGYLMKVERVVGGWSYGIRGFANYWLDEWRGGGGWKRGRLNGRL